MNFSARFQLFLFGLIFTVMPMYFLFCLIGAESRELQFLGGSVAVPAEIKSAFVESKQTTVQSDSGSSEQTVYAAKVLFTYKVDGRTYEGNTWRLEQSYTGMKQLAEADLAPFKSGTTIKAWVDPSNPSKAVLARQLNLGLYGIVLMLSIFVIIGSETIMAAVVGLGSREQANPVQQFMFDLPCLLWAGLMIQQFFQYFSQSSPPYSMWSFGLVGIALLVGSLITYMRLVSRGILPSRDGTRGQAGSTWQFGDQTRGANSRQSRFTEQSFGSNPQSFGSGQPVSVGGRTLNTSKGPWTAITFVIFGVIFVARFFVGHSFSEDVNPERNGVYSKDAAVANIGERNEMVRTQSDNPYAYKQRGTNYFDAEQYEKAIPDLSLAISKTNPPNDEALLCRARCYVLTQQWKKGLEDFTTYLKYTKDYGKFLAHRGMGICSYHLKQFDAAAKDFTFCLAECESNDDSRPEIFHDRALSFQQSGKSELAQKDLKEVGGRTSKWWLK